MSTLRFHAIKETFNRPVVDVQEPARRSEIFGKNVFNENGDVPTHFYLMRDTSHKSNSTEVSSDLELLYDELNI